MPAACWITTCCQRWESELSKQAAAYLSGWAWVQKKVV
jgi:hypothetical protein